MKDAWFGTKTANDDGKDWQSMSGCEARPPDRRHHPQRQRRRSAAGEAGDPPLRHTRQHMLMLDQYDCHGKGLHFPEMVEVDALNGTAGLDVKNPGDVAGWGVGHTGRAALKSFPRAGCASGSSIPRTSVPAAEARPAKEPARR